MSMGIRGAGLGGMLAVVMAGGTAMAQDPAPAAPLDTETPAPAPDPTPVVPQEPAPRMEPMTPATQTPAEAPAGTYGSTYGSGNTYGTAPAATPAPARPDVYNTFVFLPTQDPNLRGRYGYYPRSQTAILLGGGVANFANSGTSGAIGTGGAWAVRALAGTRQVLGLEAAYTGAALPLQGGSDATLMRNGGEVALRLQIPFGIARGLIEPYGMGGVGWYHYSMVNGNAGEAGLNRGSDDTIETPVGGGLMFGYNGFLFDARFLYRFSFYDDLRPANNATAQLDSWTLSGNVGWEF